LGFYFSTEEFQLYITNMKQINSNNKKILREQIMQSALASFKIEGILISKEKAFATLKKIETILEK